MINYKKSLISIVLGVCWHTASAEWSLIEESSNLNKRNFMDINLIKKDSNFSRMWILIDYTNVQKINEIEIFSLKELDEYDCSHYKFRILSLIAYDMNMGAGSEVMVDNEVSEWFDISSNRSNAAHAFNLACKK